MRDMTVTDFLGNFDWLLDRDQVTDLHWVLVAVFLGHLLTLLNWLLYWDLKYTMKGETEMLSSSPRHSAPWAPCCKRRLSSCLEPRCSSSEGSSHTSCCCRAQSKAPCNLSHTPPRTTSRIQSYIPPRRKSHTRMKSINLVS